MARQGKNPAKAGVPAYQPHRLGIVTLVYIPEQAGYFAQSLEIFKYHLASVHKYTDEPFNHFVFDNGSCLEVKRELVKLREAGLIDWLFLSEYNMGKTGALNMVFPGMPNEWICFTDSDMLFRPGWLEASWEIEKNFPNCGMIGAQIVFPDVEIDKGNTAFRKTSDPQFRFSQFKPDDWIVEEYCRSRGIPEKIDQYREMPLDKVTRVDTGVEAVLGGNSHPQFLARREVLQKILPLPAAMQLSRKEDTYQDAKMDELGYLHLTVTRPYLYHMGNIVDPEILPELEKLGSLEGLTVTRTGEFKKANLAFRALEFLSRYPSWRRQLVRLYDNLYQVLLNRKI